jgi:hypothetical protein
VSVEIADVSDGVLTVRITGELTQSDLERAQAAAVGVIRKHGKVRVLVIATDFRGWEREGDWGDTSFSAEHDRHIEKIAIVGDRRWEDLVLAFMGKGFRRTAIEYFMTADLPRARTWIGSSP